MTAFSPIWFSSMGSNIFLTARANTYCCWDHDQLYFFRFRLGSLYLKNTSLGATLQFADVRLQGLYLCD